MNMGARQARLWRALGLGPVWRERSAGPSAAAADAVAGLDWDALERTVADCTACGLCRGAHPDRFRRRRAQRALAVHRRGAGRRGRRPRRAVRRPGRAACSTICWPPPAWAATAPGRKGRTSPTCVKCRPPGNRNPEPAEVAACAPYLHRQVALLRPRIIVLLGRFAVDCLLETDAAIGSLRGRVHAAGAGRPPRPGGRHLPSRLSAAQPRRKGQELGRPLPGPHRLRPQRRGLNARRAAAARALRPRRNPRRAGSRACRHDAYRR